MMLQAGHDKLLELGAALDAWNVERPYDQQKFFHDCGMPACAAGLWAHLHPATWDTYKGPFRVWPYPALIDLDKLVTAGMRNAKCSSETHSVRTMWSCMFEFDLSWSDACSIFGTDGCGCAKTAAAAATFIREFVTRAETPKISRILQVENSTGGFILTGGMVAAMCEANGVNEPKG